MKPFFSWLPVFAQETDNLVEFVCQELIIGHFLYLHLIIRWFFIYLFIYLFLCFCCSKKGKFFYDREPRTMVLSSRVAVSWKHKLIDFRFASDRLMTAVR